MRAAQDFDPFDVHLREFRSKSGGLIDIIGSYGNTWIAEEIADTPDGYICTAKILRVVQGGCRRLNTIHIFDTPVLQFFVADHRDG